MEAAEGKIAALIKLLCALIENFLVVFFLFTNEFQLGMSCFTESSPTKKFNKPTFFFNFGRGSGTLMKPKYHFRVVGGLLVQELEPEKDLKAEKG